MSFGFDVEIWGDYACFTQPEQNEQRVSYDIITPSAARGILEAVLWKPAIEYVIDRIAVCAPIRFDDIARNEFDFEENLAEEMEHHVRKTTKILRNVRYVVTAHFNMTDNAGPDDTENKFSGMIRRRLEKGQYHHAPYLGMREFPARIRLVSEREKPIYAISETRFIGRMLYDLDYQNERTPKFFSAEMYRGIVDLRHVTFIS